MKLNKDIEKDHAADFPCLPHPFPGQRIGLKLVSSFLGSLLGTEVLENFDTLADEC
jgi:hypothetical protein